MESVNHPAHYNQIPGIECIDVVEHFNFNIGNVIKYAWRAGLKSDAVEDLKKALWYCQREIERIEKETKAISLNTHEVALLTSLYNRPWRMSNLTPEMEAASKRLHDLGFIISADGTTSCTEAGTNWVVKYYQEAG